MTSTGAAPTEAAPDRRSLGRPFRHVWLSVLVSSTGDGMFVTAFPLLAATLTRDPRLIAGVTIALRLPWLVLSLFTGAIADRLNRRRLLMAADLGRLVVVGGLVALVVLDMANIWILYVCAFLLTTGDTLHVNTAQALLPDIVEEIPQHLGIQNDHQREWLRFSSTHWNVGRGKLQIRGGGQVQPCTLEGVHYDQCTVATQEVLDATGAVVYTQPAGTAFFHPEHNHWHQAAVADFEIHSGTVDGPLVVSGDKTTYCFIDYDKSAVIGPNSKIGRAHV